MANLPPLNALPAFAAAAKHQSFTRAAQELNLTHGAVSRAVKQLEDHFGLQLFDRRNRRVYLTEKGAFFAAHLDQMFDDLAAVCEQLTMPGGKQKLVVSCEPSLAMRWLMPRLAGFFTQHPDMDIQLSTAGGPVDLAADTIDLAIRRSDFQWPSDYWVTPLAREVMVPVCSPDYWQDRQQADQVLLHTRTRPDAWKTWQSMSGQDLAGNVDRYFDHFYFSLQAAVAGLGIAIGPEPHIRDDLAAGMLIAPWGQQVTNDTYIGLSLKNPRYDPMLSMFLDWLTEQLGQ